MIEKHKEENDWYCDKCGYLGEKWSPMFWKHTNKHMQEKTHPEMYQISSKKERYE